MPPNTNIESPTITPVPEINLPKRKWRKIITVVLTVAFLILGGLTWYGFYLEDDTESLSNKNSSNLTAEKIESFKIASNVGNDHFVGSPEEQGLIVDLFVMDNSASDAIYLYFAANTANLLNRPKEAMFLFYAAQLRKHLDYLRFALEDPDGNNVSTYLGYLNEGAGQSINPLGIRNPQAFSEAIRMIEKWEIVPVDDANYPKDTYGKVKLSKDEIQSVAKTTKEEFLKDFAYKQEKLLGDPRILEALLFVQDYNFGKIPKNSENDEKYEKYKKVVMKAIEA